MERIERLRGIIETELYEVKKAIGENKQELDKHRVKFIFLRI